MTRKRALAPRAAYRSHAPMAFSQHRIDLPDGRRILAAEYGQRQDVPVIYLHGFLGSRLEPLAAGDLGVDLVALDRPGYGGTSQLPRRSFKLYAADFAFALDRLGYARCAIIGVSAGGPFALAAAAYLGERVIHTLLLGAVAERGLIRAHGGKVRTLHRLRMHLGIAERLMPTLWRGARHTGWDTQIVEGMMRSDDATFAPEVDKPYLAQCLLASMREGTRRSLAGVFDDARMLNRPWSIPLDLIRSPVTIMHGAKDRIVPLNHGRWYHQMMPRAAFEIVPDTGHISLVINNGPMVVRRALAPLAAEAAHAEA